MSTMDLIQSRQRSSSTTLTDTKIVIPAIGEAFKKLSDGKNKPWQSVTNEDYNKTVDLIKFVDSLRKKS